MENCIVTKGKMGKPFRDLAQHYKVSIPELEKITYKYRKLVGEDDAFPSPTFINAELGKIPYKESPELVENAHKIWEVKYSKDITFDKDTEAIKRKEEAEALFPKEVIHLYFNSEGKVVLSVQEPVAEIDIKHRKDFPDWQNYNDYLLVMGDLIPESERDKEKKQLGPQPFTFNDGTTVTAPFKPNEQQVEALNAMSDFINSDEVSMTLSGYAGTGKTSLMELIAAKMKKEHKNIVFSASTNKAAAVLRDRVKKAGFTAQTLNKVFGISVEVDSSKPYDAANLVNKLKEAEITPGTIVVIDEASMINEENYRILNDIAKENGLKIIYTGDKGQLAPVNESQISKVFRDKNGKVVTLTKVERTEDNAILKEATAVRNGQPLSGESSFNSEGKGVAYMKPTNKEGKKAIVEAFVPQLKKNPDFFRILAYTNKAVADYNTAVRNALGYHDNTPRVGEPIVGYSNWGAEYDRRTKQTTYRFINSESYKVTEVKPAKQVYYSLDDGTRIQMTAIPITIEDAMGKREKVNLMDIKGNPQNLQAATMLAKEKARLFNVARHLPRREQPAIYQQINAIEKFLFVNDSIKEGGRTLQNKTFDFGYAMTVHKSQGSTFTHVLVDDADISTARNQTAPSDFDASVSMLDDPYSAMEGAQPVDLGFDSASSDMQVTSQGNLFAQMQQQPKVLNAQTINREANNAANIRQQLEYVAVSRATDTVTIISNNVKKEDSPLNHLPKAEISEAPSLETNRKEMTPQLIQQVQTILSPLGNKVHGLADMQKYFQEHSDAFDKIQQAVEEGEMAGIKAKAIANGTFMKAPNGKDTNLTERQWLQVRTKNFINWFGDWINDTANASKVVDENGEPLVVYHGSKIANIRVFKKDDYNSGYYFTSDINYAKDKFGDKIYSVFLNIKNPFDLRLTYNKEEYGAAYYKGIKLNPHEQAEMELNHKNVDSAAPAYIKRGYDGLFDNDSVDTAINGEEQIASEGTEYVVWNPNQIKSATDNNGDFSTENDDIQMFMTPDGEVYGFVAPNGDIYLDETKISPEHPIHEYTHLWDRIVAKKNPKLWKRGVQLMKKTSLWKQIENDSNYGQRWKALQGMTASQLESLIASEVHARFVGEGGQQLLDNLAKEKGAKGIIGKLKQWILDFWKDLKATFSDFSDEEIQKLTLKDFNHMTMRDFADAVNFTEAPSFSEFQGVTPEQVKQAKDLQRNKIESIQGRIGWIEERRKWNKATREQLEELTKLQQDLAMEQSLYDGLDKGTSTITINEYGVPQITAKGEANNTTATKQAPMLEASPSGQTSKKVSLPGYEYFNDLYEDTEVDAAWKIPVLQDLDSQLSTENTEDENLQILSQMDRILQSPSQEDYEKAPTPQKEETNKRMEDYLKRNQQLNNLLDNEVGLQASEIRDTAETIMNTISDIITEIQQHPEKATEYWPTLKTDKDLSKVSRKELVETVNINRLIELAKKRFDDLKWSEDPAIDALYNSAHLLDQHDLIMNNWDAVMRFAGDIFVANEGFGIKRNSKKGNYETEVREYQGYDYDDYSSPQDPDATAEEGDEQEHWQVEAKTIDVINSMSELVRMAIHNCYVLDKSGNKVLDKWGMPKRVDKHKAVKQILYWTAGTLNINEMIDRMEAHKDRNPWVSQLTRKLADTSGNEADFQSQFYGVMHRHFQLYGIGQYEDGHYVHKILNRHNALSEVMKGISAQFQMHQHPLFNRDSTINRENLKLLEGWYGVLEAIKNKYKLMLVKSSGEGSREDYVSSNNLELSEADIETAAKAITAASRMLGYMTTEEQVLPIINKDSILRMTNALMLMLDHEGLRAQAQANTKDYKPFGFKTKNNIRGALTKFLQPMMEELEETALNTIFEDGKMYQSNTIPSFLSQLFDSFAQSEENFKPWVESFYGNSQWFKKDGMWRTPWLATMMSNPDARKIFEHHVQLNFNKHNYMRNMSPDEYIISCITNYFFKTTDEKEPDTTEAWFRVPIQSNKPSSEFIKFFSFRGTDYKDKIVAAMQPFFLQELDRIDTVRKRNKQEGDASAIASWDEYGRHFMFLPFLNSYLVDKGKLVNKEGNDLFRNADGTVDTQKNNELKTLLNKKLNAEKGLTPEEEVRLSKLVEEATRIYMQNRADQILDNYEKNGILKAAEKVENIKDYGRSVRDNIENFLWNDFFAANNILQLTITDKAFYPTTAELQKRLAELHAPGTKANKYATDYQGNRVSDGIYRTILISDYEGFTANIIDNLTEIFNRKIAQAPESEKEAWIILRDSLVGKEGRYRKINVTDGQAYSSPSSYRKKMLMFGKWSPEAERTYQKIRNGNFTLSDLEAVFQPLKPFVYGPLHKKMGVQNAPIQEMNVPFQAKNSEYLLLMADALMQGQDTGRPNLLHTIYDIMEESERLFPTKGIDTVQFNSAIKSGAQGVVHLSDFTESGAGREQAYTALRNQMYVKNDKGEIVDYNYDTFVQSTDYDNYALQQEVPKHFQDHQQAEPSQKRANIMSDLDMWLNPQGDKADPANINYYTWKDPDGTEHKLNAQEFRKEYEKVHAKNIEDSFDDLTKLFHLDSLDRVERNIALSELLQEEIESSPRYGIDLMQACQIDPKTGDFRIPKGDPVQSKRIEQLINSIIKSRVNKQKLAGGPVVQVTNWGTSKQLHIRFNDKNDNLLPTKEEYESLVSSGKISSSLSYKDYIKENQAGIAHFEIFAPAAWKKHLEKFKNPDGTINLEAVEKCDPNLLRMITSRIPNEDKYSIAHGKIVGFLPEVAGEAIMFPYELTEIDDSDFDVDKRYCHVFEIEDIVEDTPKVRELLFKAVSRSYKKSHDGAEMPYNFKKKVNDSINMLLDNPEVMRHTDKFSENLYNAYQNILHTEFPYKVKYPKKGTRGDRNNQILNMDWAVMSNEMTASKILNPGGFDIPKHDAYVIAVYRAKDGSIKWEQLEGMTTKQLQKLMPTAGDLAWFDTQVQFYKQNAAGSNLIGVFAVNKVAHAILEADDILVDIEDVCGKGNTFTIADKEFKGRMSLDSSQDDSGAYIGKGLGSMVGASADTAKDPWLDLIGINMTTAGVYNTLLRLGMPQKDAALFMSQDAIVSALNEFNRTNLEETTTFDTVISKKLAVLRNKYGYNENSEINKEPITREELKAGLLQNSFYANDYKDKVDYKVLLAFSRLQNLAKAIRKPTLVTRLNSISSAVGPLIIDNIILEHKLMQFLQSKSQEKTGFYSSDGATVDMDDIFYNHPMLKAFFKAFQFASNRFSDMPAGSTGFKNLIEAFPESIREKLYEDRQLLSKLSDFYQSYMLVANGIINPEQIGNYINGFPDYFIKSKFKEKYPDNAFIQAIQITFDKKAGRGFLNINTTGMMEQEKERLRMAWTDLHKVNPKLSTQLFTYAFFRGGIGFSPKTWMGLVSTYVKEHLTNQRADSAMTSYVDTYRNFPTERMVDSTIMKQFVRNNWDNSKLAPKKGGEGTLYDYSGLSQGTLRVHSQKDMKDLQGIPFMRTVIDKKTYLWERVTPMEDTDSSIEFKRIMPLGNNGEYVEMSLEEDMSALENVEELRQNNEQPELPSNAQKDAAISDDSSAPVPVMSVTEQAKSITDIVKYMITSRGLNEKVAVDYVATLHKKAQDGTISKFSKQDIQRIAKDNGLNLDVDAALEWFKKLC